VYVSGKFNNGAVDKGKKEHERNIVKEREIDKGVRNLGAKNTGKEITIEYIT
jgi:hypothetical protein